jgi:hypothetical protein
MAVALVEDSYTRAVGVFRYIFAASDAAAARSNTGTNATMPMRRRMDKRQESRNRPVRAISAGKEEDAEREMCEVSDKNSEVEWMQQREDFGDTHLMMYGDLTRSVFGFLTVAFCRCIRLFFLSAICSSLPVLSVGGFLIHVG